MRLEACRFNNFVDCGAKTHCALCGWDPGVHAERVACIRALGMQGGRLLVPAAPKERQIKAPEPPRQKRGGRQRMTPEREEAIRRYLLENSRSFGGGKTDRQCRSELKVGSECFHRIKRELLAGK